MREKTGRQSPQSPGDLGMRGSRPLLVLLAIAMAIGCGSARLPESAETAPAPGPSGSGTGAAPAQTDQERSGRVPSGALPLSGTAWVIFGADTVRVEVAETSAERQRGLMYREEVPPGTGMLFVFNEPAVRSFWMQNTYVSLDIAFLDADLRVVDIQQMEARTEEFHESRAPAKFALEVQKGWLAAHGVQIGTQAQVVFGD